MNRKSASTLNIINYSSTFRESGRGELYFNNAQKEVSLRIRAGGQGEHEGAYITYVTECESVAQRTRNLK